MNKIIIKHSSIIINGYKLGDCPKLEGIFTLYDPGRREYHLSGVEYREETKQLILPRGIDIWYIEKLLDCEAHMDYKYDPYDKTGPIMIRKLPRDDIQKEALRFTLGEGEYNYTKSKSQLSVNLHTGKGKTYVSIMTEAYLEIKSIIITYSVNWIKQWRECIIEYTNIQANEICILEGSGAIFRLLNRKDSNKYKIFLVTHATIKSYGDTYGWDKVTELFKYMKVGLKIYDESHLNFDNMCKIDFYTNTYKTYYVTATPLRSDTHENMIFQLYLKNVPNIILFDEDNDPHTRYIGMKYSSHPSPQEISKCRNMYGLDRNGYANYIVGKENYYKVLHILIDLALKNGGKNLFYIGTNDAILTTYQWIIDNYPELVEDVGIYTSIITENKEEQRNKKIILSTTKSCGAAIDIKGLKMVVVLAEPFKSEVLARQTLGRTRDNDTFYIEIVDVSFNQINKFYNYKKPIFEKFAKECSEIILSDNELNARVTKILAKRESTYTVTLINPIMYVVGAIHPISFIDKNELINPITFI